ncbi:MAG: 50S ribosomal protein L21 [Bdellovibrionaceae bacterium]|nr:50S ribosomal protein L21 [Pseudobdellovibrionaceae bacterium]
MYAIVRAGGKQYKVKAGDVFKVEKMDKEVGSEFDLTEVLFIGGEKVLVGVPNIENALVKVVVSKQAKAPKIVVLKKKRRQGYRKLQGHRQSFTELFVKEIAAPGLTSKADKEPKLYTVEAVAAAKKAKAEGATEKKAVKKSASKKTAKKTAKKVAKKTTTKKTTAKKSTSKKKATKKASK